MSHKPQLDGLRFLAFLAVYFNHATPAYCRWGWAGVQFFFALSGFLITRILVRGESGHVGPDLGRYYIRRTLRIFPLYYAILIVSAALGPVQDLGWYLTYTYNVRAYLNLHLDEHLGHFWTLCVEEQFYLLYPLALLFTPARSRLGMIVTLIAAVKGFQIFAHYRMVWPNDRLLLPYCVEDLLWGCLAGIIELRVAPGRRGGTASFLAGLPLLVLAWKLFERRQASPDLVAELASATLFGLGSSLIVYGAWRSTDRWIVGPLSWAPVAYLGRISYGLYAYHLPILRGGFLSWIPNFYLVPWHLGDLALTVGVAAASWHYFEGPINRLKDRFHVREHGGPGPG